MLWSCQAARRILDYLSRAAQAGRYNYSGDPYAYQKDVIYRNNAASVRMIIADSDPFITDHVDESEAESPSLQFKVALGEKLPGWLDFHQLLESGSEEFIPNERAGGTDPMLMFFTSGTTGMPKMVLHDYNYPLGHIFYRGLLAQGAGRRTAYFCGRHGLGQMRLGKMLWAMDSGQRSVCIRL